MAFSSTSPAIDPDTLSDSLAPRGIGAEAGAGIGLLTAPLAAKDDGDEEYDDFIEEDDEDDEGDGDEYEDADDYDDEFEDDEEFAEDDDDGDEFDSDLDDDDL